MEIAIYREVDFLMMLENATSKTQDALKSIGMGNFSYGAILDGACGSVPKKKFEQIRKDNIEMLDKLLDYVTKYKGLSPRTKEEKREDVAEWKSTNLFANRA